MRWRLEVDWDIVDVRREAVVEETLGVLLYSWWQS